MVRTWRVRGWWWPEDEPTDRGHLRQANGLAPAKAIGSRLPGHRPVPTQATGEPPRLAYYRGGMASRLTPQRAAVTELLTDAEDFRSAQQLHRELRERGRRIGLATVYRTLQVLTEAGEVDVLHTADGEAVYRRCSEGHHHHLVCRRCGRAVEVAGPGVESWARRVAREHGFHDVEHTMELYGICGQCARES